MLKSVSGMWELKGSSWRNKDKKISNNTRCKKKIPPLTIAFLGSSKLFAKQSNSLPFKVGFNTPISNWTLSQMHQTSLGCLWELW